MPGPGRKRVKPCAYLSESWYGGPAWHPDHPHIVLLTGRGHVRLKSSEAADLIRDLLNCLSREAFEARPPS